MFLNYKCYNNYYFTYINQIIYFNNKLNDFKKIKNITDKELIYIKSINYIIYDIKKHLYFYNIPIYIYTFNLM
jgi:hypothetical protein